MPPAVFIRLAALTFFSPPAPRQVMNLNRASVVMKVLNYPSKHHDYVQKTTSQLPRSSRFSHNGSCTEIRNHCQLWRLHPDGCLQHARRLARRQQRLGRPQLRRQLQGIAQHLGRPIIYLLLNHHRGRPSAQQHRLSCHHAQRPLRILSELHREALCQVGSRRRDKPHAAPRP